MWNRTLYVVSNEKRLDAKTLRQHTVRMKTTPKRATVYFDAQLHRALRLKAVETSQSLSTIVNDAVRRALAEDAEDLAAFEERAKEPNLAFEAVLKDLRKRGKI